MGRTGQEFDSPMAASHFTDVPHKGWRTHSNIETPGYPERYSPSQRSVQALRIGDKALNSLCISALNQKYLGTGGMCLQAYV
jgi:hypothetical protein